MKLNLYIKLLIVLISIQNSLANLRPLEKNPNPIGTANNFYSNSYYRISSSGETNQLSLISSFSSSELKELGKMSLDPIRFTLSSNKDSININEEIELTISAELIDISPSLIFTFEEQYNFSIKLLKPKGFIITGGNYFDYTKGKLSPQNPKMTFKIKGYFENYTNSCFGLLRGGYDATASSLFIEKDQYCPLFKVSEKTTDSKSIDLENNTTKELNAVDCSNLVLEASKFEWTANPSSRKPQSLSFILGYDRGGINFLREITEIKSELRVFKIKNNGTHENLNITPTISYGKDDPRAIINSGRFAQISISFSDNILWESGEQIIIKGANSDGVGVKIRKSAGPDLDCDGKSILYNPDNESPSNVFTCNGIFSAAKPTISGLSKICGTTSTTLNGYSCVGCTYNWYQSPSSSTISTTSTFTTNVEGTYFFQYRLGNSCVSQISEGFELEKTIPLPASLSVKNESQTAIVTSINAGESIWVTSNCDGVNGNFPVWSHDPNFNAWSYIASPSVTTTYTVSCKKNGCVGTSASVTVTVNPEQCTKPSSPSITGNLSILRDAETTLTGTCTTGTFSWGDGEYPNSRIVKPLATTVYLGYCTNNSCRSNATSFQVTVQAPVGAPPAPTIAATPKTTIADGESIILTASGCDNGGVTWNTVPETTGSSMPVSPSQTTIYKAKCTVNNKSSDYSLPLTITVVGPCTKPTTPSIATNSGIIVPGESSNIVATGCSGTVKWFLDNNEIATSRDFSATLPGAYRATCTNDCGVSDFSNIINIYLEPLKIIIDQPTPDVYLTQQYYLTAQGCNNGYVIWLLPPSQGSLQVKYTNPIHVTGPGVYKATCVLFADEWKNSGWASLTVNAKPVDAPVLTRSDEGCLFPSQTTLLTATGCANAQYLWNDGTTSSSTPAYKTIGPGTYWVQCCSGPQCGSVTQLQICTKEPEPITISANKTEANHNEQVIFNAEGCGWGIVNWKGPNGQTAQGREVTMYGPGRYEARCYYNDLNFGPWASLTVNVKTPGALTLSTSKQCVQDGESNSLSAVGCPSGNIVWEYLKNGVPQSAYGKRIDVMGPGTYTAYCISYGISGPGTTLTVSACVGNKPIVNTDKSWARPSEPVKVFLSGCDPNLGGHWIRITYPNGSQTTSFGSLTVMGPFTYEAGCMNSGGALMYGLVTGQVGLSSIDYIQVVANKNKVFPDEEVSLTAYGCDFGFVEWKIGETIIREDNFSITTLKQYGAGEYFARCVGDYTKNREWVKVFVESAVGIAAVVTGPNRLCPGTTGVLFGTNCPSNYWYQWYLADRDHVGGAIQEFRLPQTAKVRCYKNDNSHVSAYTEFVIEPAFPVAFEARSNSPVALGGVLQLTATDLAENTATYTWTPPSGVSLPPSVALNQRTISVPDMKPEYNGTYTLKTVFQGCEMIKEVVVNSNTCENLYIKANNSESGAITTKLTPNGSSGGARLFKPHTLTVMNDDGNIPPNALFRWEFPVSMPALSLELATASSVQTAKIGKYKVEVSIGNTTCPLEIDLSGEQCNPIPSNYVCGTTPGTIYPASTGPDLPSLGVNDVFTAADFNVTVTEITGGNSSSGWTGRGYIGFNLMNSNPNGPPLALGIEVELNSVKINDCYELTAGTVVTVYDPTWSGIIDLDKLINLQKKIKAGIDEIILMINNSDGSVADKAKISNKINDLNALGVHFDNQPNLTSAEITGLKTGLSNFTTAATCKVGTLSSSSSGRLQAANCNDIQTEATNFDGSLNTAVEKDIAVSKRISFLSFARKLTKIVNFYNDCSADSWKPFPGGIVPQCTWRPIEVNLQDRFTSNDPAMYAGLLDGFYSQAYELANIDKTLKKLVNRTSKSFTRLAKYYIFNDCDISDISTIESKFEAYRITLTQLQQQDELGDLTEYEILFRQEQLATQAEDLIECNEVNEVIKTVDLLYDFVKDYSSAKATADNLISLCTKYYKEEFLNKDLSNVERYKQAKLISEALTIVAPSVVGLITKVGKIAKFNSAIEIIQSNKVKFEKILKELISIERGGVRAVRTLEQIAPEGIIPYNSQINNLFHKWFDNLLPEELDLVLGNAQLKETLADRIRYPGALHEWCMVCEIKKFKLWNVKMSEIHRFRTKTLDLTGINPITGEVFAHGGAGSTAFHNELRQMIQNSNSIGDFNNKLIILINRWSIDPSLLPPLIN